MTDNPNSRFVRWVIARERLGSLWLWLDGHGKFIDDLEDPISLELAQARLIFSGRLR